MRVLNTSAQSPLAQHAPASAVAASGSAAAGMAATAAGGTAVTYGWRGGYYGWRGGYWGSGAGLGLAWVGHTLPYYYSTYWWGGVPYYYADNTYYRWNGRRPVRNGSPACGMARRRRAARRRRHRRNLIVYPKNGQSQEQQGKDKFECHRWAVGQTGFDPTQPGRAPGNRSDYFRAQAACLEGRGYSVK